MKVTVNNLQDADLQDLFDTVATHLLKQNEKARDKRTGNCRYRVRLKNRILRCAAGCLIPRAQYRASFEDVFWGGLPFRSPFDMHIRLLQNIHDRIDVDAWHRHLKKFATDNHLKWDHIKGLS